MQIAKSIEQLARECFARLCPWIAKEYPEFPVEKSTTMQAFIEGAKLNDMYFGTKTYQKEHSPFIAYYLTINGRQVGTVCFSQREVDELIQSIKRGEPWK